MNLRELATSTLTEAQMMQDTNMTALASACLDLLDTVEKIAEHKDEGNAEGYFGNLAAECLQRLEEGK